VETPKPTRILRVGFEGRREIFECNNGVTYPNITTLAAASGKTASGIRWMARRRGSYLHDDVLAPMYEKGRGCCRKPISQVAKDVARHRKQLLQDHKESREQEAIGRKIATNRMNQLSGVTPLPARRKIIKVFKTPEQLGYEQAFAYARSHIAAGDRG